MCFLSLKGQYIIRDVNVIPMNQNTVLGHRTVVVSGDRITEILEEGQLPQISDGFEIIDGSDKYLIPGYSEMHAHIPVPEEGSDALVKETLFLYLANGITTIRGMLGDPYHLELKRELARDDFASPRIYTSSPSLNGNTVPTRTDARDSVVKYKAAGYDFLKIHPGIKVTVFDELVRTADSVGIDHSGHVPMDVGIEHAIVSRYATIDHLDGYVEGLVPVEQRPDGGFFGILLAGDADISRIPELVQNTKEAGIGVVPTQTLMTRWLSPVSAAEMVNQPEMKYISPSLRFSWRQSKEQMLDRLDYDPETYQKYIEIRQEFLRSFHEAGVPILLGSDAPQVFNVPGFSIHHEMKSMQDAGLSPYDILFSASVAVARFFNASDRGTIQPGMVADMVLLAGNPLEDISQASTIEGVMYRGNWLSAMEIKDRLDQIEAKYKTE